MDDRSREIVGNTAAPVHVHAVGSADLADDSQGPAVIASASPVSAR